MTKFESKIRIQLMVKSQLILSQLHQESREFIPGQEAVKLQLNRHMQRKLERVTAALNRIEQGEYGQCLQCKRKIDQERLEISPEAEMCIHCQQRIERNQIHTYAHAYI